MEFPRILNRFPFGSKDTIPIYEEMNYWKVNNEMYADRKTQANVKVIYTLHDVIINIARRYLYIILFQHSISMEIVDVKENSSLLYFFFELTFQHKVNQFLIKYF